MHEIGIASSIIDAVRKEIAQHPLDRAERVGIRIGELTALDKSALQFCFEVLTRDTELERLKLEVDCVPRRHRCPNCPNEHSAICNCFSNIQRFTHFVVFSPNKSAWFGFESFESVFLKFVVE